MAARKNTVRHLVVICAAVLGGVLGYAAGYNLFLDWLGQQAHALFWFQVRSAFETESFYRILLPTLVGAAGAAIGAQVLLRRR